jgi:hypothetical protein
LYPFSRAVIELEVFESVCLCVLLVVVGLRIRSSCLVIEKARENVFGWLGLGKENGFYIKADGSDRDVFLLKENENK